MKANVKMAGYIGIVEVVKIEEHGIEFKILDGSSTGKNFFISNNSKTETIEIIKEKIKIVSHIEVDDSDDFDYITREWTKTTDTVVWLEVFEEWHLEKIEAALISAGYNELFTEYLEITVFLNDYTDASLREYKKLVKSLKLRKY